jgi:hypothetical protein
LQRLQAESITRRLFLPVAALLALLASAPHAAPQGPPAVPPAPRQPGPPSAGWQEAPGYVALFAPRLHRDAYRAWVSARPLDELLKELNPDAIIRSLIPLDAFGQSGRYDRWRMARLYGGRRVRVARFPRPGEDEAWTLASPYPDLALERMETGTLLLALRLDHHKDR